MLEFGQDISFVALVDSNDFRLKSTWETSVMTRVGKDLDIYFAQVPGAPFCLCK